MRLLQRFYGKYIKNRVGKRLSLVFISAEIVTWVLMGVFIYKTHKKNCYSYLQKAEKETYHNN